MSSGPALEPHLSTARRQSRRAMLLGLALWLFVGCPAPGDNECSISNTKAVMELDSRALAWGKPTPGGGPMTPVHSVRWTLPQGEVITRSRDDPPYLQLIEPGPTQVLAQWLSKTGEVLFEGAFHEDVRVGHQWWVSWLGYSDVLSAYDDLWPQELPSSLAEATAFPGSGDLPLLYGSSHVVRGRKQPCVDHERVRARCQAEPTRARRALENLCEGQIEWEDAPESQPCDFRGEVHPDDLLGAYAAIHRLIDAGLLADGGFVGTCIF